MQSPLGEQMQSNADPIASVMRERQCRLKDFQREYRPTNLWSLMALGKLLIMHIVGLQEHRRVNSSKITWFAEAG